MKERKTEKDVHCEGLKGEIETEEALSLLDSVILILYAMLIMSFMWEIVVMQFTKVLFIITSSTSFLLNCELENCRSRWIT